MLTHSMELETPPRSDVGRSFLLQSISCQVLTNPCHCRLEHSDKVQLTSPNPGAGLWLLSPQNNQLELGLPELCKPNGPKPVHVRAPECASLGAIFPALLQIVPVTVICEVGCAALPTALPAGHGDTPRLPNAFVRL